MDAALRRRLDAGLWLLALIALLLVGLVWRANPAAAVAAGLLSVVLGAVGWVTGPSRRRD